MPRKSTNKLNLECSVALSRRHLVKAVIVAILTVVCGYFNVRTVYDFIEDPIGTKIAEHVESEAYLPDIMICPMDPLNITMLRLDGYSNEAISAIHWHFVQDQYKQIGRADILDFRSTFEVSNVTHFVDRKDWAAFVKNYSLDCSELFVQCSYSFVLFNCCATAQPVLHEKQGTCYRMSKYNYRGGKKIQRSGGNAGLVLILNAPEFNDSDITVKS